jgi:predicted lipoprotein with Yx(FWY)xxD motif
VGAALGLISLILALLLCTGSAAAATIGQLAPDSSTQEYHEGYYVGSYYYPPYYSTVYHPPAAAAPCSTAQDYLQASVESGGAYVVPANGEKITAWHTNATTGAGQQMTLKVFRKVGATTEYEVVGHDGPRTLTAASSANGHGALNTFGGLSIPVQPGDVIGLYPNAGTTACMFVGGGAYMSSGMNLGDGTSGTFTSSSGERLNLTADIVLTGGGPTQHTLTSTVAGTGSGAVQSSPAGIEACSSTCSHAFDDGTKVTLSATPDGYSTFAGWSGGGCAGTGACEVTIGAETTVTATFNENAGGGYGPGYEYPSGSYGTPTGENAGGNPATPRCHRTKARGNRRSHCVRRTKLVAKRARSAALGNEVLVTKKGRTLYSLSAEHRGTFICTGSCLSIWHPLTVPAGMLPLGPVRLGTVSRSGVGTQVTYHGRPLYTFNGDTAKGEANGQGIQDVGTWGAVVVPPPKHGH